MTAYSHGSEESFRLIKFCLVCGKAVEEGTGKAYFSCSEECAEVARRTRKRTDDYCVWCGKKKDSNLTFASKTHLFCSADCDYQFYHKKRRLAQEAPSHCCYCHQELEFGDTRAHPACIDKINEAKRAVKQFCEKHGLDDITTYDLAAHCRNCGKPLPKIGPDKRHDIYCSDECKAEDAVHGGHDAFCLSCGKLFYSRGGQSFYCGSECRSSMAKNVDLIRMFPKQRKSFKARQKTCPFCFITFVPQKRGEIACPKCNPENTKTSWDSYEEAQRKAKAEGKWISYGKWQAERSGYR